MASITEQEQREAAKQRHPAGKQRTARQRWADRIAPMMGPDISTLDLRDGVGWVSDNAALYGGDWS